MSEETRRLKIDIDYKLPALKGNETEPRTEGAELTANYLEAAVTNVYPQGLEGQLRRVWARIQRKVDAAIEADASEIELNQAECDFLRKAFDKCKAPVAVAKYFIILEDLVEEATKRIPEQTKET